MIVFANDREEIVQRKIYITRKGTDMGGGSQGDVRVIDINKIYK